MYQHLSQRVEDSRETIPVLSSLIRSRLLKGRGQPGGAEGWLSLGKINDGGQPALKRRVNTPHNTCLLALHKNNCWDAVGATNDLCVHHQRVCKKERRAAFNPSDLHHRNDASIQNCCHFLSQPLSVCKVSPFITHHPTPLLKSDSFQLHQFQWREKSSGPIITFDPASTCRVGSSERTEHFANATLYLSRGVNANTAPWLPDSFKKYYHINIQVV